MSLTGIAKKIGLSVDSVKKRIQKMKEEGIFRPKIQLRPRAFGFSNVVDIKIRFKQAKNQRINEFIEYTMNHPRVAESLSVSGSWDFTLVVIAKDHVDLGKITNAMKKRFDDLIDSMVESTTTFAHKFEEYDMNKVVKEIEKGEYEEEKWIY